MSLKRIGCGLLAVALSIPLFLPVNSYAFGKFTDTYGHWAESYIARAYNQGFISGYPDGLFRPDKSVSRAEFVCMVNDAFGIHGSTSKTFADVAYNQWYHYGVSTAVSATYAGGYSDDTFRPNNPISREEAAVMLSRILPSYKSNANLQKFRDYRLIDSWAVKAMEKMCGKGYFGPYDDNKLHPTDSLTRAQTAKILCDMLNNETFITKNATIDQDGTKLTEKIYTGDVYIDEDLGTGSATIDNCVILGKLYVRGGGSESVTINNSRISSAEMERAGSTAVRLVIKGETTIPELVAYRKSILQSSVKGQYGIQKISVEGTSEVTLKGDFPYVSIDGSHAAVSLESGKIANLIVSRDGDYSDITLTGKAGITEATVHSESYFHGTGTITHMTINSDGVTYETKPLKMSVGTTYDRAIAEGDVAVSVSFSPKSSATEVYLDVKPTVTFNTAMKKKGGSVISDSDIPTFLSLHKGSKSGEKVEFTATINSAKKVITITPKNYLEPDTRYYIVLEDETLQNAGGYKNNDDYSHFTTGTKTNSPVGISFSPSDGSSNISLTSTVTIQFTEDVVKYSDSKDVTDAYLSEGILFKKGSASGENVAYSATISSSDKITITPTASLTAGQKYYVSVVANKFKSKANGSSIQSASVTWTTASSPSSATTPAISSFQLTPGQTTIQVGYTPNVSGTFYALACTGSAIPTDAQILSGSSTTATANSAGTLTLTGLNSGTSYTVYGVLRSTTGTNSSRVTGTTQTSSPSPVSNINIVSNLGESYSVTVYDDSPVLGYKVSVPFGTTSVDISATPVSGASVLINGVPNPATGIAVDPTTSNAITVSGTINSVTSTYTLLIQVNGNMDLSSLVINGVAYVTQPNARYYSATIPSAATSVTISVDTLDSNALINFGSGPVHGPYTITVPLNPGNQVVPFSVLSNLNYRNYQIQFSRLAP